MKNKIRNYQIQTRLGSGSYGVIFKAINKADKQQCVLKQIKMSKMSQKAKKSTLNEATIMGKLIHPFIVQYKQSFVQEDTLHIVMEYCDNGDLSMYLKMQNKKPLKQQKIWKFFIQICLGLQYIHKNKILHRDIKTLNIFLNKNQDVKIGDLGVAKMLMANDFAQTIVGTPFYLSPQLCQQKPYNEKSDIWALGCLLYELCTFRHPFEAANQASLILKIIRGKYNPIPQFYSKQLKDVIDMCLQRDYKRRPTANMILQRTKIRQYIKQFKLEQKIKDQYQRIKSNKQNKQPLVPQTVQKNKVQNPKIVEKKVIDDTPLPKNIQSAKKQIVNNNKVNPSAQINQNRKLSVEKKQPNYQQKKPTISGMPQQNIILPDKNNIIQKLKPNNIIPQPKKQIKQIKPSISIVKHQDSNKKILQSKQQFLKNLQKVIDNNINQKRSPIKDKVKASQQISTSAIFQQKTRLQKIDLKIQQQLKKQQQIQKLKNQNDRKKSQTPSLYHKSDQKLNLAGDRKSVPALIPKQSNKDLNKYQKPQQNGLIPPLPPKNKQQIIKIKMQQPVQGKVFQSNKSFEHKSKGIIKSRGFTQELQQQNYASNKIQQRKISDYKRKSTQNMVKPVLFGLDQQERQKQQNKNQLSEKKSPHFHGQKSSQYHSQRNIKLIPQMPNSNSRFQPKKQPQRYLFKKKPQAAVNISNSANSRVRKGVSNYNQLSRNAKNASKYNDVTKQDQDVVMNLPDSLNNQQDSSDDQKGHNEKDIKMNKNFQLKDINNSMVLQKYEQILNSKSIQNSIKSSPKIQKGPVTQMLKSNKKQSSIYYKMNKNLNQYNQQQQYYHPQQRVTDSQLDRMMMQPSIVIENNKQQQETNKQKLQYIPQNQSLAFKTQQLQNQDEILDQSQQQIDCQQKQIQNQYNPNNIQEQIYQVYNFNLNQDQQFNPDYYHNPNQYYYQQNNQLVQQSFKSEQPIANINYPSKNNQTSTQSQWSFDQQPQLPMLQDKQSPFFQQANPYLVVQQQQQTIQQKKNYLQIRLQQNIKRQDQINKLMQIKIQQCRSIVPKFFQQILQFFRNKINKQDQYTQNDQKQVQQFLRKKGLTDQRKFQNIYKIMHFQMQLQNTRKIIQRICKKLSELDNNKDLD